jgi:hypothetical protein
MSLRVIKAEASEGDTTFFPFVMLRHEASSSPCIAAMLVEEDPSLSLRMTKLF